MRAAFHYCLALVMVESGKARLVETRLGKSSADIATVRRMTGHASMSATASQGRHPEEARREVAAPLHLP